MGRSPFLYVEYSLIIRLRFIIKLIIKLRLRLMGLRTSVNGLRPWHAKRLRRCYAIIKH